MGCDAARLALHGSVTMPIEISSPTDLPAILAVTRNASVFSEEEVDTVQELFEGFLSGPDKSGYNFLSYREGESILGFACWGPTALSKGTIDLYWIATSATAQGKGVGSALFRAVVEAAQAIGRWLVVIWTSSRPEYQAARSFYRRMGCTLALQLPDFYEHGEDLCVFTLRIDQPLA
jgi:ribosomal protein S18 acetylase RimI-like enzyme